MALKPGYTYDFKYDNWHHDPTPHLYVISSDREYTNGFNLHYLPMVRLGLNTDHYRKIHPAAWNFVLEGMMNDSYYKELIDILNTVSENAKTGKEYRRFRYILEKRYPYIMDIYRTYFTRYVIEVKEIGQGVV